MAQNFQTLALFLGLMKTSLDFFHSRTELNPGQSFVFAPALSSSLPQHLNLPSVGPQKCFSCDTARTPFPPVTVVGIFHFFFTMHSFWNSYINMFMHTRLEDNQNDNHHTAPRIIPTYSRSKLVLYNFSSLEMAYPRTSSVLMLPKSMWHSGYLCGSCNHPPQ